MCIVLQIRIPFRVLGIRVPYYFGPRPPRLGEYPHEGLGLRSQGLGPRFEGLALLAPVCFVTGKDFRIADQGVGSTVELSL